jgi:hypothetical protein
MVPAPNALVPPTTLMNNNPCLSSPVCHWFGPQDECGTTFNKAQVPSNEPTTPFSLVRQKAFALPGWHASALPEPHLLAFLSLQLDDQN